MPRLQLLHRFAVSVKVKVFLTDQISPNYFSRMANQVLHEQLALCCHLKFPPVRVLFDSAAAESSLTNVIEAVCLITE